MAIRIVLFFSLPVDIFRTGATKVTDPLVPQKASCIAQESLRTDWLPGASYALARCRHDQIDVSHPHVFEISIRTWFNEKAQPNLVDFDRNRRAVGICTERRALSL